MSHIVNICVMLDYLESNPKAKSRFISDKQGEVKG